MCISRVLRETFSGLSRNVAILKEQIATRVTPELPLAHATASSADPQQRLLLGTFPAQDL